MSTEEQAKLVAYFQELKLKPKLDNVDDFRNWMSDHFGEKEEATAKKEPDVPPPSPMMGIPPHFPHPYPMQPPRLSLFSGDKKDAEYDVWKYEVQCLKREGVYPDESILHALRRSVKGEAARVLMNLGPTATIKDVLTKFDSVYGSVHLKQSILSSFYSAKQSQHEDTSTFANRIVDLLNKAVQQGSVNKSSSNEMLCSVFYSGLKQSLRDICAYKFDQIKNFDELLLAVRRIEKEHQGELSSPSTVINAQSKMASEPESEIKQLASIVKQLAADVHSMKESKSQDTACSSYTRNDNASKNNGFMRYQPNKKRLPFQNKEDRDYVQTSYNSARNGNRSNSVNRFALRQSNVTKNTVCYRCFRKGHVQKGCFARYDINGNPLN